MAYPFFRVKKLFVDAQDLGTNWRVILVGMLFEPAQEVALHGGGADALAAAETTPVDAVQVLLIDHLLETLAGSLKGLNARQLLPKESAAAQATTLPNGDFQDALAKTPVVVTDGSLAPAFVAQTRASAVWARYRAGMPGRYRNRSAIAADGGNLKLGQA